MGNIISRFDAWKQRGFRAAPKSPTQTMPSGPTEEELRASRLHVWASDPRCAEDFLPLLDDMLQRSHNAAHLSFANHPETSHWLGYAAACMALRELFHAWRDNRLPTPQKGPTP